jgi:hypothetical protein
LGYRSLILKKPGTNIVFTASYQQVKTPAGRSIFVSLSVTLGESNATAGSGARAVVSGRPNPPEPPLFSRNSPDLG